MVFGLGSIDKQANSDKKLTKLFKLSKLSIIWPTILNSYTELVYFKRP